MNEHFQDHQDCAHDKEQPSFVAGETRDVIPEEIQHESRDSDDARDAESRNDQFDHDAGDAEEQQNRHHDGMGQKRRDFFGARTLYLDQVIVRVSHP